MNLNQIIGVWTNKRSLEQLTIPGLHDGNQEFRGMRKAFCLLFEKYYWDFVHFSEMM